MRSERPRIGQEFFKAHGLGNDYLVFEQGSWAELTPLLARRICDRHRGPGGDGIVVVGAAAPGAETPLRMFNPDGGEFERSGNGLRIAGVFLKRRADGSRFPVVVAGDRVLLRVGATGVAGVHDVIAEMGRVEYPDGPPFVAPGRVRADGAVRLTLDPGGASGGSPTRVRAVPVSVGNPHAVVFGGAGPGSAAGGGWTRREVARYGPQIERHAAFPQGTNVQFAELPAGREVSIRIWERGVGPTLSSGTSACAVVAAAVRVGLMRPGAAKVVMEGGEMEVELRPDGTVRLRGAVEEVCVGTLAANLAGPTFEPAPSAPSPPRER